MTVSISIIAVLLGIVEGLTEFLPISSTGHLIVADHLLKFKEMMGGPDRTELFEIVIQLGAILAIGAIYRKDLVSAFLAKSMGTAQGRLRTNLLVAFLPAAIVGFLFHKLITTYLFSPLTVGLTLLIGGVVIILIEKRTKEESRTITLESMTSKDAFIVGCAQVLSLIPGTSRAAATIMGGMLRGVKRASATEFSFLLAFPIMIAASAFDLIKHRDILTGDMMGTIAIGFVTSFVVALAVVAWFIRYVQRHAFTGFGVYRIVFGGLVLGLWWAGYLG